MFRRKYPARRPRDRRRRRPLPPCNLASKLPQELTDLVIDLIAATHDRATLKACSLVCHSWRSRSQAHLHRKFTLTSNNICCGESWQDRLVQGYASPNTGLGEHVQSLCIRADGVLNSRAWEKERTGHMTPLFTRLAFIINIEITGLNGDTPPARFTWISQFARLRDLTLRQCTFLSLNCLTGLICSLPQLSGLTLERVDCHLGSLSTPPAVNASHRPLLHSLSIQSLSGSSFITEELVSWLVESQMLSHLDVLEIGWDGSSTAVNSILRGASSSLRTLRMFPLYPKESLPCGELKGPGLDLSYSPFLTSVALEGLPVDAPYLPSILASLGAASTQQSTLRSLRIMTPLSLPAQFDRLRVFSAALEATLKAPVFLNLQEMRAQFSLGKEVVLMKGRARGIVQTSMGGLVRRGLLKVTEEVMGPSILDLPSLGV